MAVGPHFWRQSSTLNESYIVVYFFQDFEYIEFTSCVVPSCLAVAYFQKVLHTGRRLLSHSHLEQST